MKKRSRIRERFAALLLGLLLAVTADSAAHAAQGDCSQPLTSGSLPSASDCLFILRAAVGSDACDTACICAPKGSLPTSATDALVCLKSAVGQSVTLTCPCGGTTLTSTTIGGATTTTTGSATTTTMPPGANIIIVNLDGSNEGFNDKSPRSPVGGNPGTTLGQQRLNVFNYVADLWSQVISSTVDIRVDATFDPLYCDSFGAILGMAGAAAYVRDFQHAPLSGTWYPVALASKLAGADLRAGSDVVAQFNSTIGTTCSLQTVWYYGLDGNAPDGEIDLATVVLHELGHGLGFMTLVDLGSGAKAGGYNDVFMRWLEDHSTAETYPVMTDFERVTASIDDGDLHWKGPAVVAASSRLTSGRHAKSGHVQMYAPNPQQPGSSVSHWDTALFPNEVMEPAYTGPIHDVGLMRELFDDLGWDTIP